MKGIGPDIFHIWGIRSVVTDSRIGRIGLAAVLEESILNDAIWQRIHEVLE